MTTAAMMAAPSPTVCSTRCPTSIMLVQETGDQVLEVGRLTQPSHGNGVIKELVLDIGGQIIPLHDDGGTQAPQNMLLFLAERDQGIAIFLRGTLGGAALVVPAGEGLGSAWAFACAVRHVGALALVDHAQELSIAQV